MFRCLNCAQRFDYQVLRCGRKLAVAAEHLIDGTALRLSFEFYSPHVIERCYNYLLQYCNVDNAKVFDTGKKKILVVNAYSFTKARFKRRILHEPNQILILVDSNK